MVVLHVSAISGTFSWRKFYPKKKPKTVPQQLPQQLLFLFKMLNDDTKTGFDGHAKGENV